MAENLVTVQFKIPEGKLGEMKEVMAKTGIKTNRDLVENAVALFLWAVQEVGRGFIIASVDEPNRQFKQFTMPSLEAASFGYVERRLAEAIKEGDIERQKRRKEGKLR